MKHKDKIIKDFQKGHFDSVSQIDDESATNKHPRPDCFKPMAVTAKSDNNSGSSSGLFEEIIVAKHKTGPVHKRHST